MAEELKDQESKIIIPSVDSETGKRELNSQGMSLLAIVNASLNELVAKVKDIESRVAALEKQ